MRKYPLVNGHCYHIISRSIAKFEVFKNPDDCFRLMQITDLFRYADFKYKYSNFLKLAKSVQLAYTLAVKNDSQKIVDIIAYCIMPTHIHLLLRQNLDQGITKYIAKLLNSYSRYFNLRHHRKGPLWEGHFKNILVSTNEQLIHLTRYIHLNPTSAGLVKKPEQWHFSSFGEFTSEGADGICEFEDILRLDTEEYYKFVNSRIEYQKELSIIKNLLIENYAG